MHASPSPVESGGKVSPSVSPSGGRVAPADAAPPSASRSVPSQRPRSHSIAPRGSCSWNAALAPSTPSSAAILVRVRVRVRVRIANPNPNPNPNLTLTLT